MVRVEDLPKWEAPDRPWRVIIEATAKQESVFRQYADELGYKTLAPLTLFMWRRGWDYFDLLKEIYPQ